MSRYEPYANAGGTSSVESKRQPMTIDIESTVDFVFKRVLGSPEHPRVTIHFLHAVLVGSPRITQVTILTPYLEKDFEDDKFSILDVRAIDEYQCPAQNRKITNPLKQWLYFFRYHLNQRLRNSGRDCLIPSYPKP